MAAIESTIIDTLISKITTGVPALNYVAFDRVKLAIEDFQPHELPAVQLYDTGQNVTHHRGYKEVDWLIALEIIMRGDTTGVVNQKSLLDLRRDVELVLWDDPSLGISEVIHLLYQGNVTDLHLLAPHYIARMDFIVKYRDTLTGSC